MPTWTIYCHTHVETSRRYVGLTKLSMMKRWNRHVYCAMRSAKGTGTSHFANAIRKYGKDAFSHEVLETCTDLESANAAEQKWISRHDTRNPERGFNLTPGGGHTPHPVKNPWDRPGFREKHADVIQKFIAAGQSPEARARSKASLNTPESRTKRSAAMCASMADPIRPMVTASHSRDAPAAPPSSHHRRRSIRF